MNCFLTRGAWALAATLSLLLAAQPARAQVHAGDIEITISSGTLFTSSDVYESDFADTTISYETDEPGFDSEVGTWQPGDELGFNVLQKLWYHDGSALASPTNTTDLKIVGAGPDMTTVTTSSGFVSGFTMGTANSDGVIHKHVDFVLNPYPSADVGIYGLVLQATSPSYASSDPFMIVFNNGLTDNVQFEAGVDAITHAALVPEPSSLVLCLAGSLTLSVLTRRSRAAA